MNQRTTIRLDAGDDCYRYRAYGVGIVSDSPLGLPEYDHDPVCDVECRRAPAAFFLGAVEPAAFTDPDSWYRHALTPDGCAYSAWDGVGEFLVAADGRRIFCRQAPDCADESFQVYLLGQALAVALVQQHFEPLHATAVVADGRAIAFLGQPAFGKSTLAACFLEGGHRLLTDDLLVLRESSRGLVGYPGPARLKMFPHAASHVLGSLADGQPMNATTQKLILPLEHHQVHPQPVILDAVYLIAGPRESRGRDVTIEPLPPGTAFLALLASAFNRSLTDRRRLERQFDLMTRLAGRIAVRKLTYPRSLERLAEVRAAVLADAG
jgi:hypothetical protein